ncbi:hypothetical protein EYC80_005030 [Monilinia laxa]|uniref:Anaphase-promoting complex subunit 4 WD40 domain-containing protein n=1 Tax=Monilinia laxa TaxID=61186 RepID=A0A5N6KIP3_MONLA|nr:hypothetical protein EYC80_005030 [Monilinia laxa]
MEFPSNPLTQLTGSNGPVHALTYSSSPSTYILTGSADRNIRLYNPSRPAASSQPALPHQPIKPTQLIQTYSAHGYEVLSIAVASTNATFASCGGDRSVFLWDVQTAKTIRKFGGNNGHTSRVNSVVFGGNEESVLVSGGFDRSVRIWDIRAGNMKPVMVMEDAKDSVSVVLAGKGGDEGYGVGSGKLAGTLETDVIGGSVTSLMRTRDGRGVLVGSLDGCIRLMDREGGSCLKTYKDEGFKNEEFRVRSCFGGNEKWVLSGNENVKGPDGEVIVWETLTGNVQHRIKVEGSKVEGKKKIGRDGKEKERTNVISAIAWKENGKGDQWCCAGTDGVVTVFGPS